MPDLGRLQNNAKAWETLSGYQTSTGNPFLDETKDLFIPKRLSSFTVFIRPLTPQSSLDQKKNNRWRMTLETIIPKRLSSFVHAPTHNLILS